MADILNGFSRYDIPLLLVQLFTAIFIAWLIKRAYVRKVSNDDPLISYFLVIAVLVVLITSLARMGIQSAIVCGAVMVVAGNLLRPVNIHQGVYLSAIIICSAACGLAQLPLLVITFCCFYLFLLISKK